MSSEVYSTPIYTRIQQSINDRLHGNLSPISVKRRTYKRGHVSLYTNEVCTACTKTIEDEDLIVRLKSTWHRNCFRCKLCKNALYSWYFCHGDSLYCHSDFKHTFCNLCNSCATAISGPTMVAGEHNFHPECFRCQDCENLIGDSEPFTLRERSRLYCGSCDPVDCRGHVVRLLTLPASLGHRDLEIVSMTSTKNSSRRWRHHTDTPNRFKVTRIGSGCHSLKVDDTIIDINGNMLDSDIRVVEDLLSSQSPLSLIIERESDRRDCPLGGAKSLDSPCDLLRPRCGEMAYDHGHVGRQVSEVGVSDEERVGGASDAAGLEQNSGVDQSPRRCGRSSSLPTEHPYNSPSKTTPTSTSIGRTQSVRVSRGHQFRPRELKMIRILGKGGFGVAYLMEHIKTGAKMVTKELLNFRTDDKKATDDFTMEVRTLKELNNPYVLKYIGFWLNPLTLVTEYAPGGTLKERLLDDSVDLCWMQRISYATNIAEGMAYLHENKIIHRDLNSNNCLINKLGKVIVADFGGISLSHDSDNQAPEVPTSIKGRKARSRYLEKRCRNQSRCGIGFWSAPEMLDPSRMSPYDQRVDIYSYGIVVCEIIGRVYADPDLLPRLNNYDLDHVKFYKLFCDVQRCPLPFFNLARLCSQMDKNDRPEFDNTVSLLKSLRFGLESGTDCTPAPLRRFSAPSREQICSVVLSEESDLAILRAATVVPLFPEHRGGVSSPAEKPHTHNSTPHTMPIPRCLILDNGDISREITPTTGEMRRGEDSAREVQSSVSITITKSDSREEVGDPTTANVTPTTTSRSSAMNHLADKCSKGLNSTNGPNATNGLYGANGLYAANGLLDTNDSLSDIECESCASVSKSEIGEMYAAATADAASPSNGYHGNEANNTAAAQADADKSASADEDEDFDELFNSQNEYLRRLLVNSVKLTSAVTLAPPMAAVTAITTTSIAKPLAKISESGEISPNDDDEGGRGVDDEKVYNGLSRSRAIGSDEYVDEAFEDAFRSADHHSDVSTVSLSRLSLSPTSSVDEVAELQHKQFTINRENYCEEKTIKDNDKLANKATNKPICNYKPFDQDDQLFDESSDKYAKFTIVHQLMNMGNSIGDIKSPNGDIDKRNSQPEISMDRDTNSQQSKGYFGMPCDVKVYDRKSLHSVKSTPQLNTTDQLKSKIVNSEHNSNSLVKESKIGDFVAPNNIPDKDRNINNNMIPANKNSANFRESFGDNENSDTKPKPFLGILENFSKKYESQFNQACNITKMTYNSDDSIPETNAYIPISVQGITSQPSLSPTAIFPSAKTPPNIKPKPTRKTIANSMKPTIDDNSIESIQITSPKSAKLSSPETTNSIHSKANTSMKITTSDATIPPPQTKDDVHCGMDSPSLQGETSATRAREQTTVTSSSPTNATSEARRRSIRQQSLNYEQTTRGPAEAIRRNSKTLTSSSFAVPLTPPPAGTGFVASRIALLTAMFEPVVVRRGVSRTRSSPCSTSPHRRPAKHVTPIASSRPADHVKPSTDRPRRPISLVSSSSVSTSSSSIGELELLSPSALTCSDVPLITVRRRVQAITSSSPTCSDSYASMHRRISTTTTGDDGAETTTRDACPPASPTAILIESKPNAVRNRIAAYEKLINGR